MVNTYDLVPKKESAPDHNRLDQMRIPIPRITDVCFINHSTSQL
jgi:hypothetical protein